MNKNLLGIDFEDWFHPELIKKYLGDEKIEPKVVKGIDKILELLRKNDTNATFFVVGELLEYEPEILDKILENGHEIERKEIRMPDGAIKKTGEYTIGIHLGIDTDAIINLIVETNN